MAAFSSALPRSSADGRVKAVLGPTNTGKTHLAIERLCAHSSGAIGFPLRLLAREVYDRVCAIKGENRVALITGEERIEPKDARWLLCTAEAMPVLSGLASPPQVRFRPTLPLSRWTKRNWRGTANAAMFSPIGCSMPGGARRP